MLVFFQKWLKPAQPNFLSLGVTTISMLLTLAEVILRYPLWQKVLLALVPVRFEHFSVQGRSSENCRSDFRTGKEESVLLSTNTSKRRLFRTIFPRSRCSNRCTPCPAFSSPKFRENHLIIWLVGGSTIRSYIFEILCHKISEKDPNSCPFYNADINMLMWSMASDVNQEKALPLSE